MANELRVYQNFTGGRLDADAASGATSLSSPAFAALPVIDTSNHMLIAIDPDGLTGEPFVLRITAHTAAATTVTVDATGSEGTTVRAVKAGCDWVHSVFRSDFTSKIVTATYTGGDITCNNASWTDVHTSLDVTIACAPGDLIEYVPSLYLSSVAGAIGFDVATIVSGTRTNYFGSAPGGSAYGVSGWLVPIGRGTAGSHFYSVVSGDISGGTVTFRLIFRGGSALVSAIANIPAKIQVINHGQHI